MNLQNKTLTEDRAAGCSRVIDWLIILFYLFYSISRRVWGLRILYGIVNFIFSFVSLSFFLTCVFFKYLNNLFNAIEFFKIILWIVRINSHMPIKFFYQRLIEAKNLKIKQNN